MDPHPFPQKMNADPQPQYIQNMPIKSKPEKVKIGLFMKSFGNICFVVYAKIFLFDFQPIFENKFSSQP